MNNTQRASTNMNLTPQQKAEVKAAVKKTIKKYKKTLQLLAKT